MRKLSMLLILSTLSLGKLVAQKSSLEIVTKSNAISTQMIFNKRFAETSKFGLFSMINVTMPYEKEDVITNIYSIQASVVYAYSKNFILLAGGFTNKKDYGGSIGFLTRLPFKNGNFFLSNRNAVLTDYSSEFLTMTEYRPKLFREIGFYSRLQTLVETDFKDIKKNAQLLRVGLEYKQFQFGVAAAFNVFSNEPLRQENFGIFLRTEL
jgi:hypothetical protein